MLNNLLYSDLPTCLRCFWIVLGSLFNINASLSELFRHRRILLSRSIPTSSPGAVLCPPGRPTHPPAYATHIYAQLYCVLGGVTIARYQIPCQKK